MIGESKVSKANPIWHGPYKSWAAACKAAKKNNLLQPPFTSDRWLNRIKQQLIDYRNEVEQFGIAQPPRPCNLPWIVAMTSTRSIIDFGGSSGWAMDLLQNTLPENTISSYSIVELETVVEHMQNSRLHDNDVIYRTFDDQLDKCDLLYSNSVLQYFESNVSLLELVKRTAPKYILLEDLHGKGEQDFFGTQIYYNLKIPYRFIGLKNLLNDFSLIGYHKLLSFPYVAPNQGTIEPCPMDNFPSEYQIHYPISILLERM